MVINEMTRREYLHVRITRRREGSEEAQKIIEKRMLFCPEGYFAF